MYNIGCSVILAATAAIGSDAEIKVVADVAHDEKYNAVTVVSVTREDTGEAMPDWRTELTPRSVEWLQEEADSVAAWSRHELWIREITR